MEKKFPIKPEEFEKDKKIEIQKAWKNLKNFLNLFPFRKHPEKIDDLTSEKIYAAGDKNTFFYWPEFGLKDLGRVGGYSAFYAESARDNSEKFKELLKKAVDDNLSLSDKIDAWKDLKRFGNDSTIAKKIIFCYYPEDIIPIFSTADLEHFAKLFKLNFESKESNNYNVSYKMLSVGQKFELLNKLLLDFKKNTQEFKNWDNLLFMKFLYECYPPERTRPDAREIKPLFSLGILFTPEYEQEVVYLFSVFHRELGFPYIIKIRNEFPDADVMDDKKVVKRIEFEVRSSDFNRHKHDKNACDFIVCWENDLEDTENLPEIISLKNFIEEFK